LTNVTIFDQNYADYFLTRNCLTRIFNTKLFSAKFFDKKFLMGNFLTQTFDQTSKMDQTLGSFWI